MYRENYIVQGKLYCARIIILCRDNNIVQGELCCVERIILCRENYTVQGELYCAGRIILSRENYIVHGELYCARRIERPPLWRVAANKLNKQSWTADKGWSSSLGVGRGANNPSL